MLISGEAGIGKSRLSAWLAEQVAESPHTRLHYHCSPYHRDSALYPFVQQLERAAGIAPQEPPEAKLDKLEKLLGLPTDRMNEVAPLMASMLSVPVGSRYPPLNLSPAQQRRQTFTALLDQIEGLAKHKPLLMLFEDAHWADATSLELLDLVIESVRRLPALLLITFRPEFEAPWKGSPDVAAIALQRLDRAEAETLVERVTGGRKLPEEVLAQIVAKTDGIPLFVEELTKKAGLVSEIKAKSGMEIWRRDEETGQAYSLKLTVAGLKAILADERGSQSIPSTAVSPNTNDDLSKAKTAANMAAARSATAAPTATAPRQGTKIARVIELLQRDQGARLEELIAATGWLPHTARAALTGLRHRGYDVRLERGETGRASVYRAVATLAASA